MKKTVFSKRLAAALENSGMTQSELARKSEINKATISQYMSGEYTAKHDRIVKIAEVLKCNPLWLEGYDIDMESTLDETGTEYEEISRMLPVVSGELDSGGMIAMDKICGYEIAAKKYRDKEHFYCTVSDDSMWPMLCEGDIILCERCSKPDIGDIGLFIIDGRDIRIRIYNERVRTAELVCVNPCWPSETYEGEDCRRITTAARVVQSTHTFGSKTSEKGEIDNDIRTAIFRSRKNGINT